jgi:hypothetical protein
MTGEPSYYSSIVKLYALRDAFISLQYLAAPYINKHEWKKLQRFMKITDQNFPAFQIELTR